MDTNLQPEHPPSGIPALQVTSEEPNPEESLVADGERLIRNAFRTDARLGFELLYRRYYLPLCSHAVRFVHSKAVAEDIVSEVFCQCYARGIFERIDTSFRAYLYHSVRSRAYNYLRREMGRTTDLAGAIYRLTGDPQQPDSIIQYEELYHDLEKAINTLPLQRRKIYLMHRFENKKYAEIAAELQLATKTVEVQIRKASHFVRDLLRSKWTLLLIGIVYRLFP
jgi:RNA polymerase sigma-70 factor (ECF subfamily)